MLLNLVAAHAHHFAVLFCRYYVAQRQRRMMSRPRVRGGP